MHCRLILHAFREVRENELGFYPPELKALKLNFDEHLKTNPNSEIIGELNRINAVFQDFVTNTAILPIFGFLH
jgi:hypothetical protein